MIKVGLRAKESGRCSSKEKKRPMSSLFVCLEPRRVSPNLADGKQNTQLSLLTSLRTKQVTSSPRPSVTPTPRPRTRPWTLFWRGRGQRETGRWRSELMVFLLFERGDVDGREKRKERNLSPRAFHTFSARYSASCRALGKERRRWFAPVHSKREKESRETEKTELHLAPFLLLFPSLNFSLSLSTSTTINKNSKQHRRDRRGDHVLQMPQGAPCDRLQGRRSSLLPRRSGMRRSRPGCSAPGDDGQGAQGRRGRRRRAALAALRLRPRAPAPAPPACLQGSARSLRVQDGGGRERAPRPRRSSSRGGAGASAAVRATLLPAVPAAARAEVEKAVAEAEAEASSSGKQPERLTRAEAERKRRKKAEAEAAGAAAPMEVDEARTTTTATTSTAAPSSFFRRRSSLPMTSIDPYDLAQPLDVLSRLPKTFWARPEGSQVERAARRAAAAP